MHLKQVEKAKGTQVDAKPTIVQKPVNKPAELSSDNQLPKLYVFGDELSVSFAKDLRGRLEGKCTVMHIVSSDDEMRDFFKISQLPAAILFSSDNEELARFTPPFAEDRLVEQVEKAIAK